MRKKIIIAGVFLLFILLLSYLFKDKIKSFLNPKSTVVQREKSFIEPLPYPTDLKGNEAMTTYLHQLIDVVNDPGNRFANCDIADELLSQSVPKEDEKTFTYYMQLVEELANCGRIELSIEKLKEYESAKQFQQLPKNKLAEWYALGGITYLRLGELQNCIENHNAESCIFPLSKNAQHINLEGATNAIAYYKKALEINPDDLCSIWLMNVAYQQIGEYPQNVPPAFLIDKNTYKSEMQFPYLKNIASNLGVDFANMSGGVVLDDFNNDGLIDIFTSGWGLNEHVEYLINNGDGSFKNATQEAGLSEYIGGLNILQTDYNNDGWLDLWILRGAWQGVFGIIPNSLLKNNGNNTFTDVTIEAGLFSCHPTQTATWNDFNNDGWIDVFIGNEADKKGDTYNDCELFLNDGTGKFKNVAEEANANINSFIKGVTSGDYDNDGDPDIYLSANGFENYLLRNDTEKGSMKLKFKDVTKEAGIKGPIKSFPCWFFDFNNDGWLDIMNFSYSANISDNDIAAEYLQKPRDVDISALYINNKNGTFTDMGKTSGLDRTLLVMGSNYGDLDNDGWLDFYLGTGKPSLRSIVPNRLFRNSYGVKVQEITTAAGVGILQKGHAIAFADLNNDGYQEIFAQMGGSFVSDGFQDCLFENPATFLNNFISIDLVGIQTNKKAIGARIKITITEDLNGNISKPEQREIYDLITNGSSFGGNSLRAEIGVGKATLIDKIEITWPVSGVTQTFTNIAVNQHIKITEGNNNIEVLNLQKFPFYIPSDTVHHHHQM